MKYLRFLPNLLTLSNLLCGSLAVVYALQGEHLMVIYLLCTAAVFDFFDGFAARLTKSESMIGKDLDSLADVVSFGLAPALGLYHLLSGGLQMPFEQLSQNRWLPFVAFLLPIAAAYRLAVFNHDPGQKHFFRGLPTPANGLFWAFLTYSVAKGTQLIYFHLKPEFLAILAIIFSLLMVSTLPMLSLKQDKKKNKWPWLTWLILSMFILCFVIWQAEGVPIAFVGYLLASVLFNPNKNQ